MTKIQRSRRLGPSRLSLLSLLALAAFVACDQDRDLPTESSATIVGASVQGTVAGGKVGPGGAETVVVRHEGSGLYAVTAPDGSFFLDGLPAGPATLSFESNSASGRLELGDLVAGESVDVALTLDAGGVTVQSLKKGNGNGRGRGRGNGGGGGDDELDPSKLSLQISPQKWNLNYEHANGTVTAIIRGKNLDLIDPDSLTLAGDAEGAEALTPVRVKANKKQIQAKFAQNEVLDLLDDPHRGSTHTVVLAFTDTDGNAFSLEDEVTIVGKDDDGEDDDDGDDDEGEDDEGESDLVLQLSPSTWNLNFDHSAGTVQAFLRGDGLGMVDLKTIVLVGDDPEAEPLEARSATREGNHVRARFGKRDVLDLLLDPEAGSVHEVSVQYEEKGSDDVLTATTTVRVVGGS